MLSSSHNPPPAQQQQQQPKQTQDSGQTSANEVDAEAQRPQSDPAALALYEHQSKLEDNMSLLDELGAIEAELRESLRLDIEREQEDEFLRQQENQLLWQGLSYLSLNQRVAKPWVSSYFRKFPMHIYCLPVQAANQKKRKRNTKKK
ncbi:hypothetical protein WMY93_022099 [Mugilogobius chulae]|uniref:Uncharacterized protein n=1 Tax=Mugilogobius chulae TaxID=88201 RepID=A0AAW0NH72_9GOBI